MEKRPDSAELDASEWARAHRGLKWYAIDAFKFSTVSEETNERSSMREQSKQCGASE